MSGVHLFAGANTAHGFHSFYGWLAQDSYKRVFILKGGPGTGKSTLLKNIAENFEAKYGIDRFHCSADANSLDAIFISSLNVSILDGTSPHVIDPTLPGAVQQIIDLSSCWDPRVLIKKRNEISSLVHEIGERYKMAYRWLALAGGIKDIQTEQQDTILTSQAKEDAAKIVQLLPRRANGITRQAFASAITGSGMKSYLPELQGKVKSRIILRGGNRRYNDLVLGYVKFALQEHELPATYLHCGLQPEHLEHIFIPGEFVLFSSHAPHELGAADIVLGPKQEAKNNVLLDSTLQKAMLKLAEAASLHRELETLYIPAVDFNAVNTLQERIVREIAW